MENIAGKQTIPDDTMKRFTKCAHIRLVVAMVEEGRNLTRPTLRPQHRGFDGGEDLELGSDGRDSLAHLQQVL